MTFDKFINTLNTLVKNNPELHDKEVQFRLHAKDDGSCEIYVGSPETEFSVRISGSLNKISKH